MADDDKVIDWSSVENRLEELEYLVYKAKDGKPAERRRFKSVKMWISIIE